MTNEDQELDRLLASKFANKLSPTAQKNLKNNPLLSSLAKEIENERHVNKWLDKFITNDPDMIRMKDKIRIMSEDDGPVLITGPTGTGKELLANALHGDREKDKFIAINCAGIPETLLESELFGHVKGAFTNATSDKTGLLQSAHGGTIFLDEVAELTMPMQAKLLRAIQEKKIRRIGSDIERGQSEIPITCRFVFATHMDLLMNMRAGVFREDFYWRISTFRVCVKALNERSEDIPLIVKRIITEDRGKINYDIIERFKGGIAEFCIPLIKHKDQLTGNVRQLQQIVRNYHLLGELPKFD